MPLSSLRRLAAATLGGAAALALALPAMAEPALWKVQSAHATVYLFGTVHVLKPTTVWRSPKIEAALNAAGTLWEEVPNADDAAAVQPLVMKYGLDPTHALSDKLDDAGKAKLATVAASYGLQTAQLEPLRPWMAALTLSILPVVKAGYDPKSGVDNLLKAEAVTNGKSVQGFETLEQQVRYFADLPEKLEVDYLLDTLDDASKGTGLLDQMVDAWAAGDTAKLEALLNSDLKHEYPQLYKLLLADRNQHFADRIEELLKGDGVYFVAVGAAHLTGPDSVQADLARHGVKAVRQ